MRRKKELSFPRQCWHCILLAVILLFCVQICCGVLGTILYWDCIKSALLH